MSHPHEPEAATRPASRPTLAAAGIEPMLTLDDLAEVLNCDRRTIERMRAAGRLPRPDLTVGRRSPRWKPETIRRWINSGGKGVAR